MPHPISRRRFLLKGAAGAGLAAGLAIGRTCAAEGKQRPLLRVACRDAMLKGTGEPDIWSAMKRVGVEGVEAALDDELSLPGLFHPTAKYSVATAEGRKKLAADLDAAGLAITSFCMFNRFEERPEFEISWGRKAAEAAQALGVPAIRIDLVPRKMDRAAFAPFALDVMKKLLASTEHTQVAFGIENHGHTTNDPEFLGPLFDGVGTKRLGLTLDTGNFYWFGHPLSRLYQLYEQFAPRVHHTHFKSIGYPADQRERQRPIGWRYGEYNCPIDKGDIDIPRVVSILKAAGYANDLCIEDESLGKTPAGEYAAVLAREVKLLASLR